MGRDPARAGCAAESLDRGEAILATASRVRRWLLVEQPGPWGADALTDSRFPPAIAARLAPLALAHRTRVLLIRRSLGPTAPGAGHQPRTAFLVRSDRAGRWAERIEFTDPAELLDVDLAALGAPEPPGVGEAVAGSVHLVCTHGRHDPCCADEGRPVVRALRAAGVDVWESSHVGGDRFAANVVCLPTGVYFGRVTPQGAARLLADHDAGLLDLHRYRGRSHLPPLVQAAEVLARRELGERRLDQLGLVGWSHHRDGAVVALDHDGATVEVTVSRRKGRPEQLTCRDPSSPAWEYALEGLVVLSR